MMIIVSVASRLGISWREREKETSHEKEEHDVEGRTEKKVLFRLPLSRFLEVSTVIFLLETAKRAWVREQLISCQEGAKSEGKRRKEF